MQSQEVGIIIPKGIELEENEEVKLMTRQHWFVFRNSSLLSFFFPFVLLSAVFFIDRCSLPLWLVQNVIQGLLVIASVCFGLGAVSFFGRLFLWSRTYYLVTSQRLILIHQRGLFSKERRETSLGMIQDVKAEVNGLQAALYGFGDVVVQISAQEAQLIFSKVGKPYFVQRVIMKEAKLS